jgi:hypothetical protein
MPPSRRLLHSNCAIVVLLLSVLPSVTLAQTLSAPGQLVQSAQATPAAQAQLPAKWNEAVHALAEKIAGAAGSSRRISLEVKNISSLDSSAALQIRQAIESKLMEKGFQRGAGGLRVRVTLSEGSEGFIWVAEIELGDVLQVAAVSLPISSNSNVGLHTVPVLQKRAVWEQADPFLDFLARPILSTIPVSVLTVLERDRVARYEGTTGHWGQFSAEGMLPIGPGSRDIRGRIIASANGTLKTFVATSVCVNPPLLYCVDAPGQEWPVGDGWESHYVPGRNYFTGLSAKWVTIDGEARPFFALSRLEYDHGSDWIQTELDGKARLFKFSTKPVAAFSGWGDDIATVKPGCGGSWHALVTGTGDWTQTDHVQLYEIKNDQPVPIGQPLEFPGPILAMWSSDDSKSARVVSKNLQTGMYEASIVSVSCSD